MDTISEMPVTGLDRLAAWLFPGLYAEPRVCNPCVDHDHMSREAENELELEL